MSQLIDNKYREALMDGAREIFETMVMMTPRAMEPVADPKTVTNEVVGVLGFSGTCSGLGVLSCSMELARQICANMLVMEVAEIEDQQEIHDAFGEVVNMVVGSFKNAWVEGGNEMSLAIPSVSIGTAISTWAGRGSNVSGHSLVMKFDGGDFRIDLWFEGPGKS